MNAIPEKELQKEEMLKKSTSPPFLKHCMGKRGLEMHLKFLNHDWRKGSGEALLDLGASVNLLPYSVYKQLGLGELKPTTITLSLADRSVKIPRGVIEDVLVQVDNFYYPVDFIVLDTDPTVKEANLVPIILGRPFLATSNAIINCRNGLMQLTFGNMTLDLNIFYMSKKQTTPEEKRVQKRCALLTLVEEHCNQNMQDKLNESLADFEEGYFQIEIDVEDQEKTTLHVHLEHMLTEECLWFMQCTCNISKMYVEYFSDMVERIMEVFMDDITVYGGTFEECLINLEAVLHRCIEKDLVLNWEKCHFMVRQGIVLGHIISEKGIEVDKAKVELIVKLPSPTTVKGVRQFLGHAGFYRRFIKGFSSLSKPLCELLAKDAKFIWDERCQNSFDQLKKFLTTTPIVRAPNWQLPFELMCDASDFAIGAVLGQREDGKPYVIYYASKTLNEAQRNYTTTEKELLAVYLPWTNSCLFGGGLSSLFH
ncbi:Retrovirus-related Pol polyprotein from transposon 17.6 [Vitis vinifera]|uniref:Retrovirus-related Pol polyprotein from transposon 17.6 n=1 Tax=Vitis vinifera TaxID=29760 RepID=A0A438DJJ4_VITVI|nr:Retrovirus-related Pol polyprotein from transposon 17.6 [Vitis vinifera]